MPGLSSLPIYHADIPSDLRVPGRVARRQDTARGVFHGKDISVPISPAWCGALGASFANEAVRLRVIGRSGAPAIVVLGGISGDRYVGAEAKMAGWWSDVVKVGGGIDLNQFQVIGIDPFPHAPQSVYTLTTADYAKLIDTALEKAGFDHLFAFVGSSFGGMVGQSYARQFPKKCNRLIVLCAAHQPSPMAQAWRGIQRKIIEFGIAHGKPAQGVALARELAMTTYRTPEEFEARFSVESGTKPSVHSYLTARGLAYAGEMSAQRYITLSGMIDRHYETPEEITMPTLLIAAESDRLVPLSDVEDFRARLGGPGQLAVLTTPYGHDAFLKEAQTLNPIISRFLLEV